MFAFKIVSSGFLKFDSRNATTGVVVIIRNKKAAECRWSVYSGCTCLDKHVLCSEDRRLPSWCESEAKACAQQKEVQTGGSSKRKVQTACNSQHRLITAFTRAQTSFESTIDYVLWDLKTVAPGMTLRKPARWNNTPNAEAEELSRKHPLSSSSLEERTAAALAKLLRLGYVSQARKILEMSKLLRTKFTPSSLATIARAVAKMPSVILPEPPPPPQDPIEALSSELPLHLTTKIFELSTKWFLWELRPQLYDAAKRKRQDAVYTSHLRCAVEEFMWRLFDLRDWTGVLETFDGTAMNLKKAGRGGGIPPSVKMCQLAMQAVFARHYYDAPGKENKQKVNYEARCQRETSGANTMKDGYGWTKPSDHRVLFKKIAGIVEVMRKSGVDPLYPEVHAIVLRELGWLVSSGKTLMSVKLVEDWLVYYEAAMAVRVPPKTSPPSTSSQPPPSIILAAAEAILNILEESKHQLDFNWSKTGQIIIAQKHEYLENTLECAFEEVMGYLEGRHSAPIIGETVEQHAKVQSVLIRRYLLQDDVRAAWSVWTKLVEDVEEAREPRERPSSKGKRSGDQLHRGRTSIPQTTSLRLDSAYARILETARRLDGVEFICTTALPSSSRILVGQNTSGFAVIWRKTLEALARRPPVEEERLRLLGALRTLDNALEEGVASTPSTTTQPSRGGCRARRDILRDIFTGSVVKVVRLWWSRADQTAESTKRVGELFEKFEVVLKGPSKRSRSRAVGDV
ncbi:hypothetical protein FRC05_005021 [Tulasnella sp. 425]|nr:hypothetical protein FRC05_005021 [Tulasnella sp. 425]